MTKPGMTDEMLMAFVDGELDEASAAAVSSAAAGDPELSRRIDSFKVSRRLAREAFGDLLSEPPPDRLINAIMAADVPAGNVVPLKRHPRFASRALLPLAASLLLAVGFGGGFWFADRTDASGGGLISSAGEIASLLADRPSGSATTVSLDGRDANFIALGSYRVTGGICRMFRVEYPQDAVRGLACDRGAGFSVDVAVSEGSGTTGFTPASDLAASTVDAYLDTLEAEGPLDKEEEGRILAPGKAR
ncbi:MAG: hypothetical protein QHC90_01195 [Shinella sp.]|nr:hypothetical protein [Shinella sp.]